MSNQDQLQAQLAQLSNCLLRQRSLFETEKGIIARQIHDDLSQNLTALSIQFELLSETLNRRGDQVQTTRIRAELKDWQRLVTEMIGSVRNLVTQLRPKVLDEFGIIAALEWQTGDFARRAGLEYRFSAKPETIAMSPEISIELFRIFQGMLLYLQTFSGVSTIEVQVRAKQDQILLRLAHDGRSSVPDGDQKPQSMAYAALEERVESLMGSFSDGSHAGRNTMTVAIPLPAPLHSSEEKFPKC